MDIRKCLPVLALLAFPHAFGLCDVPLGGLLWIQGYDGNPPQPGFTVEGLLRIEAVDDSQPAGLELNAGSLTNRPSGLIQVNYGAGGGRFISGTVYNEGTLEANTSMSFLGDGSLFRNSGSFQASDKIEFRGLNTRLELLSGSFSVPEGVDYRDGTVAYDGGDLTGDLRLVRSRIRVAASVTNGFHLEFSGAGCAFDGVLTADRSITAWAGDEGTGTVLDIAGERVQDGTLTLSSRGALAVTTVHLPPGGWTVRSGARLETLQGSGGYRLISGDVRNEGTWVCTAGVIFSSQTGPVVNTGTVDMSFTGVINSAAGFRQEAGLTTLLGGSIYAPDADTVLAGGRLTGGGHIYGRLVNQAVIEQVQWLGPLLVEGRFQQDSAARLSLTLHRSDPTNAILIVTGEARLGGVLDVAHVNPAVIEEGQKFRILKAQSVEGWFSDVRLPALRSGLSWEVRRQTNGVDLVVGAEAPVRGAYLSTDEGTFLEITGRVAQRVRVEVSGDLTTWTPLVEQAPFPAYAKLRIPEVPLSTAIYFYRTSLED